MNNKCYGGNLIQQSQSHQVQFKEIMNNNKHNMRFGILYAYILI